MILYGIHITTSIPNTYIYNVLSVRSWRVLTHLYYQRTEKRTDRGLKETAFHVKNPRNNRQRVSLLAAYSLIEAMETGREPNNIVIHSLQNTW